MIVQRESRILLTDEENPHKLIVGEGLESVFDKHYAFEAGAKAQLKKVVEWGEEDCTDRSHSGTMPRRSCGFCWQSLLEEIR